MITPTQTLGHTASTMPDAKARQVAKDLEAAFVSQMLKSAGVGASTGPFSGGSGEDQFASFLRDAQAREMVKAGGIGLAESIFAAMKVTDNESPRFE